jgi:hypothetical protein
MKILVACEFSGVVNIIYVYEDKEAEVQRERFVKQRKERIQRKGGFY